MKKIISMCLVLTMCLALGVPASAEELVYNDQNTLPQELINAINKKTTSVTNAISQQEKDTSSSNIDALYDQLSTLYLEIELEKENQNLENSDTLASLYKAIDNIHQRLEQKGSIQLNNSELSLMSGDSMTPPPDTSNVEFQAYGPGNYYYGGKKYKYYRFTAIPKTKRCILSENGSVNMEVNITLGDYLKIPFSIYEQKAIGLIPFVQWTPYELLFGGSTPSGYTKLDSDYTILTYYRTNSSYYFVANKYGVYTQGLRYDVCHVTEAHNIYYENGSPMTQYTQNRTYLGDMDDYNGNQIQLAIDNIYHPGNYFEVADVGFLKYYRQKSKTSTKKVLVASVLPPAGPNSMYSID